MPIDPNIILGVKPAQFQQADPLDSYAKSLTLQHLMKQGDLQDVQTQTAQQGLDSGNRLRALFSSNPKATADDVMAIDPKTGMAMRKSEGEARVSDATARQHNASAAKSDFDVQMGKLQHGAALLANAKDQQSFDAVLRVGALTGTFDPKFVEQMQTHGYSPELVKSLQDAGVTREQQLQAQNRDATLAETARGHDLTNTATLRGQDMTAATAKAGQGVTVRGQNMVDARAAQTLDQPKMHYDAERGIMVNERTGATQPAVDAAGKPIAPKDKPLTESQGKAGGMSLRATRANDILNTLEDRGETNRGIIKQGAEHIPIVGGAAAMGVNMLPGALGGPSGNQQKVEQARRDFVNAALRVESGASISSSEFQNAEKQYFPMPGDKPEVIAQKRANRQSEIDALNLQAGPTAIARSIRSSGGGGGGNPAPPAGGLKFLGFEG